MYAINGSGDQLYLLERTTNYVNTAIAVGSDVKFVIAEGLTHIQFCEYASYLEDAVDWIQTDVWIN